MNRSRDPSGFNDRPDQGWCQGSITTTTLNLEEWQFVASVHKSSLLYSDAFCTRPCYYIRVLVRARSNRPWISRWANDRAAEVGDVSFSV